MEIDFIKFHQKTHLMIFMSHDLQGVP